jgi:hypothetical protein
MPVLVWIGLAAMTWMACAVLAVAVATAASRGDEWLDAEGAGESTLVLLPSSGAVVVAEADVVPVARPWLAGPASVPASPTISMPLGGPVPAAVTTSGPLGGSAAVGTP